MHPRVEAAIAAARDQYRVIRHSELPLAIQGPHAVAAALSMSVHHIAKTLLMRSRTSGQVVALTCSVDARVDVSALIPEFGRLELAPREEVERLGYPPQGISPLGLEPIPLLLEAQLLGAPRILVGAGVLGVEIAISPQLVAELTKARVCKFAR